MTHREAGISAMIEEDHERLKQSIETLAVDMEREVTPEDFPDWKLQFLWQLRDFQNQLLKHFDLEEEGGFMAEVVQMAPRYAHRVEHLEEEHHKIIADLGHIVSVFKSVDSATSSRLPRVRERIQALISLCKSHEAAENNLIQEVYFRDYGVGD